MWRVISCSLVILAGCGGQSPTNTTSPPSTAEVVSDATLKPAGTSAWPTVTAKPIPISPLLAFRCAPAPDYGPHLKPSIVVRTNPESLEAFQAKQSPMPVGTVVVKEKHETEDASDATKEFGAMIKREPGFDPEHGDWEYVYGKISPGVTLERGKLASCIACHEAYAKDRDYLFRSYLPDKGDLAQALSGR